MPRWVEGLVLRRGLRVGLRIRARIRVSGQG